MPTTVLVPIVTWKTLALLCSILVLALVNLSLSLVHLGLTSFFLGLIAAGTTIIHTLTQLAIIFFRSRRGSRLLGIPGMRWEDDLPPTSKMACLAMDALLAVLFMGAFTTTLLIQILDYFNGRGSVRSIYGGTTATFKVHVGVVYAEAVIEALCTLLLVALTVVGHVERKQFFEWQKRIPESSTPA